MAENQSILWRRFTRFSLTALLLLLMVISCFVAGERYGYRKGLKIWNSLPLYTEAYSVADLLEPPEGKSRAETLDDLATHLKHEIMPVVWEDAGGRCKLAVFQDGNMLIVNANQYVHDEMKRVLDQMRQDKLVAR